MRLGLILCALLIGCSGGNGSSSPGAPQKSLFAYWISTSCTNFGGIDLSLGTYSTNFTATYHFGTVSDCKCNCTGNFTSSGNYTITGCVYEVGSCTAGYSTCSSWNDNGIWFIQNVQLTFASNVLPNSQKICQIFK